MSEKLLTGTLSKNKTKRNDNCSEDKPLCSKELYMETYTYNGQSCYNSKTFQGGIKSVIWTDVFQCIILIAGLVAILILVGVFI